MYDKQTLISLVREKALEFGDFTLASGRKASFYLDCRRLTLDSAGAVLVAEALRVGDLDLLRQAMDDSLHQPYRLPLIPGGREAMEAGQKAGAAVALSGAGPGCIAFSVDQDAGIGEAMKRAFESAGLNTRIFELGVSNEGTRIETPE